MKFYYSFIFLAFLSSQSVFASDTTYRRSPWQMAISFGLSSNRANGSMADFTQTYNHEFNIRDAEQKDGGGFLFNVTVQREFANYFYVKSGLGLIQKNVNPEEKSYPLYKDSLNTGYIFIPVLIGARTALNPKKTIGVFFETGVAGNFKILDKSYCGPDRVAFKINPFVLSFQASGGFNFALGDKANLILQYTYSADLTNAYMETLYLGATNLTYYVGNYKWLTNSLSLGIQWPLP